MKLKTIGGIVLALSLGPAIMLASLWTTQTIANQPPPPPPLPAKADLLWQVEPGKDTTLSIKGKLGRPVETLEVSDDRLVWTYPTRDGDLDIDFNGKGRVVAAR